MTIYTFVHVCNVLTLCIRMYLHIHINDNFYESCHHCLLMNSVIKYSVIDHMKGMRNVKFPCI